MGFASGRAPARTRAVIAALLAAIVPLSGCYSLTNLAFVGFSIGAPTKVDSHQPDLAVADIVGASVQRTEQGSLLHLAVRLEDGETAHLVASDTVRASETPRVVTFEPAPGPLPPSDVPLIVPDFLWVHLDGSRKAVRASQLGLGSSIHRVGDDGLIPEETTTLTAGLAAECGVVSIHLVRDEGMRRETWQVSYYPPRPALAPKSAPEATIDTVGTTLALGTVVDTFSFPGRAALLTRDGSLFGPLPPEMTIPKTVAFALLCPGLVALDTALYASGLWVAVELPIGLHYGWMSASSDASDDDD